MGGLASGVEVAVGTGVRLLVGVMLGVGDGPGVFVGVGLATGVAVGVGLPSNVGLTLAAGVGVMHRAYSLGSGLAQYAPW